MRLNYYTTDADAFLEEIDGVARRLTEAGFRPAPGRRNAAGLRHSTSRLEPLT